MRGISYVDACEILERFTIHGAMSMCQVRMSWAQSYRGVDLTVRFVAPDRDNGTMTGFEAMKTLTLEHDWEFFREQVRGFLLELWMHEFDECVQYRGTRMADGHPEPAEMIRVSLGPASRLMATSDCGYCFDLGFSNGCPGCGCTGMEATVGGGV